MKLPQKNPTRHPLEYTRLPKLPPVASVVFLQGIKQISKKFRADFWLKGMRQKHFSVKKKEFSVKRGRQFSERGFGKDFYRKGNSVKRFGPFTEPPDSAN